MANEVSHREFNRVKERFDSSWISSYTQDASKNYKHKSIGKSIFWYLNIEGNYKNNLFGIIEKWDHKQQKLVKTYWVYPEAYRTIQIIELISNTKENLNGSRCDGINW